jgi:hypothetical protein
VSEVREAQTSESGDDTEKWQDSQWPTLRRFLMGRTDWREGDMDFNTAILAHKKWKDRIRHSIESGEQLDAIVIARDDQCDLGRWIQSAGSAERALAEFTEVKAKHARFHEVASETVRKIQGMPRDQAEALLVGPTAYGIASAACVSAITALRDKIQK